MSNKHQINIGDIVKKFKSPYIRSGEPFIVYFVGTFLGEHDYYKVYGLWSKKKMISLPESIYKIKSKK